MNKLSLDLPVFYHDQFCQCRCLTPGVPSTDINHAAITGFPSRIFEPETLKASDNLNGETSKNCYLNFKENRNGRKTRAYLDFVLIPEGEFIMGSDPSKDRHAQPDEMPAHQLLVSDFYLMRHPVTNDQYRQFMEASGHRAPYFWKDGKFPEDKADHPVVGVSYHDAIAFCRWAAEVTGLPIRLPTEPEWEKAARGPNGRMYPWGEEWKPDLCNSSEAKLNGTAPVGKFSPQGDSPYGIAGMGGNIQDWLLSIFGPYPYDPADGREKLLEDPESKALTRNIMRPARPRCPNRWRLLWASPPSEVVPGASQSSRAAALIAVGRRRCIAAMIPAFAVATKRSKLRSARHKP